MNRISDNIYSICLWNRNFKTMLKLSKKDSNFQDAKLGTWKTEFSGGFGMKIICSVNWLREKSHSEGKFKMGRVLYFCLFPNPWRKIIRGMEMFFALISPISCWWERRKKLGTLELVFSLARMRTLGLFYLGLQLFSTNHPITFICCSNSFFKWLGQFLKQS